MTAPIAATRFGPPRGPDVDVSEIKPGDWAYVFGYWFNVVTIWTGTHVANMIALERPGWPHREEAYIANVTRWRKAING